MKHSAKQWIAAALFVGVSAISAASMAQSAPFIVIRFNQQRMYYEQPLYNAVEKAVNIKPDVMFDVVGVSPATGDQAKDAAWAERSRQNMQRVIASLNAMGVPSSRLNVIQQKENGPQFDEVRISAR